MGKNEKREQKLTNNKQTNFHQSHRSPTDAASDPMLHPVNGPDHPVVDSSDPPTYAFAYVCLRFDTLWLHIRCETYSLICQKKNSSDPPTYAFHIYVQDLWNKKFERIQKKKITFSNSFDATTHSITHRLDACTNPSFESIIL